MLERAVARGRSRGYVASWMERMADARTWPQARRLIGGAPLGPARATWCQASGRAGGFPDRG